jgi:hypothetical protein
MLRQRSPRQSRGLPTKDLCTPHGAKACRPILPKTFFFPNQTAGAPSLRPLQRWEATLPRKSRPMRPPDDRQKVLGSARLDSSLKN